FVFAKWFHRIKLNDGCPRIDAQPKAQPRFFPLQRLKFIPDVMARDQQSLCTGVDQAETALSNNSIFRLLLGWIGKKDRAATAPQRRFDHKFQIEHIRYKSRTK